MDIYIIIDNNLNNNDNINKRLNILNYENKKLLNFKEKIFEISKNKNNINLLALNLIKKLNLFFNTISKEFYNENFKIEFNTENSAFENINSSIKNLINLFLKDNKIKEDEYNFLLNEKNNEIIDLKIKCKNLNDLISELNNVIKDKNNIIMIQIKILKKIKKRI